MQPAHSTGWRRLIGCLKLRVIFRKRATNYRALSRKMTYEDKGSYDSTPLCVDTCGVDIWEGLDLVMYGLETCRLDACGEDISRQGVTMVQGGSMKSFRLRLHCYTLSVDGHLLNRHVGGPGSRHVQCNTLQYAATRCNTLRHTAAHCNTLQYTAIHEGAQIQECALQHTAAYYDKLQHIATHCNTLQCMEGPRSGCNTLRHTVTHCNAPGGAQIWPSQQSLTTFFSASLTGITTGLSLYTYIYIHIYI